MGTFHHVSPEATLLDAPTARVADSARRVRETLVAAEMSRFHAIDIMLSPVVASRETAAHQAVREAVTESLGEPAANTERYTLLRIVTNAHLARTRRSRMRGLAVNNWHTDFEFETSAMGIELRRRSITRRAICIDRPASRTLTGDIETSHHLRFTASTASRLSPEEQMCRATCTLVGVDGQLVRGPMTNAPELALTGDIREAPMPTGKWYELGADTVHDSAPEIPDGGIIISVDDVLI